MIEPVIGQSEEVRSPDQTITPSVSEIISVVLQSIEIQMGEGFTQDEVEELRVQGSLASIISSLYPELRTEKREEVESGIYEALPKAPPLSKILDNIAVLGTEAPVSPPDQKTQNRNPRKGDRVKNFGGKLGTVLKVNPKGLARYEIQWDGGKSEVYSHKEFNRSLFELVVDSIVQDAPLPAISKQLSLPSSGHVQ